MVNQKNLIAFGPVPSRRLGRSLGINNIPPKACSYSCVYCQVGKTLHKQVNRREFYKPSQILEVAREKIEEISKSGETVDYITFVSDGEPTLDFNLGEAIRYLKQLGIKIAVISNASLIWKTDVQDELAQADWVSLKIDSVSENIWKRINNPDKSLKLNKILEGIEIFLKDFNGKIASETMLVEDINTGLEELTKIAVFISGLKNVKSYISVPIRPPSEKWVSSPNEEIVNQAYQIFKEKNVDVEYLIGYEGNDFSFTGNIENDLLSITSVHPMRKDAVDKVLKKTGSDWSLIEKLITENRLMEVDYKNSKFYLRKL